MALASARWRGGGAVLVALAAAAVAFGVRRPRRCPGQRALHGSSPTDAAALLEAIGAAPAVDWFAVRCLVEDGDATVTAALQGPWAVRLPEHFPRGGAPPLFLAVVLARLLVSDDALALAGGAEDAWAAAAAAAARGAPADVVLAAAASSLDTALGLALKHLRQRARVRPREGWGGRAKPSLRPRPRRGGRLRRRRRVRRARGLCGALTSARAPGGARRAPAPRRAETDRRL